MRVPMKVLGMLWLVCALVACDDDDRANPRLGADDDEDARPAPVSDDDDDDRPSRTGRPTQAGAGGDTQPPDPAPVVDDVDVDAGGAAIAQDDAGVAEDAAAAPADGSLRSLSIRLSGMEEDVGRFMQFRVIHGQDEWAVMAVIHEGLPTGTYRFDLPRSLLAGEAYRLDFWVDHDGSGGYNRPPVDRAWSLPLPAGNDDVVIDFARNEDYVDIESMAPVHVSSLILSSRDMAMYAPRLFDVRVIESASGRLAGRQVREVPGDMFDLTVGSVVQPGLQYQVDISIDENNDGSYTAGVDPGWRLMAVATDTGLRLDFTPSLPRVDVGF
jgi:hypothetical protein